MHKKQPGFILIFAFVFLALITLLTEQLLRGVFVGTSFIKAMHEREHAKLAVYSGLNLALAQLSEHDYTLDSQATTPAGTAPVKKTDGNQTEVQLFLQNILPHLNRWQVFDLDEKKDSAAMHIKICISCEDGKININEVFDFDKQVMRPEASSLIKGLEIRGKVAAGAIYTKLEEFFIQRKKKVHDISEFYEISEFKELDIFYRPPEIPAKKTDKYEANKTVALQDIFTIWSSGQLDAMMLSDGMCTLLGLRRPLANDAQLLKDKFKQLITTFDPAVYANQDELWKILEPIYLQKPRILADMQGLFSKQFGPAVYSVLSYGRVGSVEQRLLAIVKKVSGADLDVQDTSNTTTAPDIKTVQNNLADKSKEQKKSVFRVVRLYWL